MPKATVTYSWRDGSGTRHEGATFETEATSSWQARGKLAKHLRQQHGDRAGVISAQVEFEGTYATQDEEIH